MKAPAAKLAGRLAARDVPRCAYMTLVLRACDVE